MSAEERERGRVLPPPADDGSITGDGCPIDPKDAVLSWWADVAAQI